MTPVRVAVGIVTLAWWLPTIVLAIVDLVTLNLRIRLALWAVRMLMAAGEVDAADQLLKRSRAAIERYGRACGWR